MLKVIQWGQLIDKNSAQREALGRDQACGGDLSMPIKDTFESISHENIEFSCASMSDTDNALPNSQESGKLLRTNLALPIRSSSFALLSLVLMSQWS